MRCAEMNEMGDNTHAANCPNCNFMLVKALLQETKTKTKTKAKAKADISL